MKNYFGFKKASGLSNPNRWILSLLMKLLIPYFGENENYMKFETMLINVYLRKFVTEINQDINFH